MKKLISVLLVFFICLSASAVLLSCNEEHTHSYKSEWANDDGYHWRECEVEECTEISDRGDHIWNEGEITAEPTKEAEGVKTYTCTICGKTKTEAVEYTPKVTVTEEGWRAALNADNFYNVTLAYSEYVYNEETGKGDSGYTSVNMYDGEWMSHDGTKRENHSCDMDSAEIIGIVAKGLDKYGQAKYDEENQRYVLKNTDAYYDVECAIVYAFEDGKLVHFEYHFLENGSLDEMYKNQWIVFDFSDYGTTDIP